MNSEFEAVLWDFGGVFTTSPFDAFARYENQNGLPDRFLRTVNAQNKDTNAWAQLERSELTADEFDTLFAEESEALGHRVPGKDVLGLLSGDFRPAVINALKVCKQHYKVGCITNNAPTGKGASMADSDEKAKLAQSVMTEFDHVIESSKAGVRKPDPKIYQMMCEALGVPPDRCVFLDDLGINLKPARELGMTTIKVLSEDQLLHDLAQTVCLEF